MTGKEQYDVISCLNKLKFDCGEQAAASGWWDPSKKQDGREIPTLLMLIVTEVAEAMEAYRKVGPDRVRYDANFVEELADVIIRIMDMSYRFDLPLSTAILNKMDANKERSHRHGGKHA